MKALSDNSEYDKEGKANPRKDRMLTVDEAISRFGSLSSSDQARVLSQLAYHFTIAGRDIAQAGDCKQQRDTLLALNEIQHKLAAQVVAVLKNSSRYPDRDFFLVLVDLSKRAGMFPYLQGAFAKVL